MNPIRLIITIIAVFLGVLLTDFLIHGVWLKADYTITFRLWRDENSMKAHMPFMLAGQFLAALAFTVLWARGFAANAKFTCACMYGLFMGLFCAANSLITYAVQPVPYGIPLRWVIGGLVQGVLLGLIAFFVYKPVGAGTASNAPHPPGRTSLHRAALFMRITRVDLVCGLLFYAGRVCVAESTAPALATPPVRTKLPEEHAYQRTLRKFMGALTEKDFEHGVTGNLTKVPSGEDPEHQHRNHLLTMMLQPMVGTKRGAPSVNAPAKLFPLSAIETPEGVMRRPVWPDSLIAFERWDYPGNPCHNNRALRLRAFVTAAANLMMLDDYQDNTPAACRSDWMGNKLVYTGVPYLGSREILPTEVRAAFEAGLKKPGKRIIARGPKGEEPNMDEPGKVIVETKLKTDGKDNLDNLDNLDELDETIPVFLGDRSLQAKAVPTTMEFQVSGKWVPATAEYREKVGAVMLKRLTGAVQIKFDHPRRVKLSPQDWKDNYLTAAMCRNVMIDLMEDRDKSTANHAVMNISYEIAPAAMPA